MGTQKPAKYGGKGLWVQVGVSNHGSEKWGETTPQEARVKWTITVTTGKISPRSRKKTAEPDQVKISREEGQRRMPRISNLLGTE